jgi:hypothetical protein
MTLGDFESLAIRESPLQNDHVNTDAVNVRNSWLENSSSLTIKPSEGRLRDGRHAVLLCSPITFLNPEGKTKCDISETTGVLLSVLTRTISVTAVRTT